MKTWTRIFLRLAGAAFLFLATGLGIARINIPPDLSPIIVPGIRMSLTTLYVTVAPFSLLVGLLCLFGVKPKLSLGLVGFCAGGWLVVWLIAWLPETSGGLGGYLGLLGGVFGLRGATVENVMTGGAMTLLAGSVVAWAFGRRETGSVSALPS